MLGKGKKRHLFSSVLSILSLTWFVNPVKAQLRQVGVVKSEENVSQWTEITQRLAATGVDYCILDAASWQAEKDLKEVRVLFLPNIETINGAQAIALEAWMKLGGQVIVTGPTGNLSGPEIRATLRELLGAYWGFPIATPSTLSPQSAPWLKEQELISTIVGGAVIPAGKESETAAVWLGDGSIPAVVVTDNATFLGWRWGVAPVASVELDTAWLEAALSRYGISGNNLLSHSKVGQPCNPKVEIEEEIKPLFPQEQSKNLPGELSSEGIVLPPEFEQMNQEIKGLIARVESVLLTAAAQEIDQFFGDKNQVYNSGNSESDLPNTATHEALAEAKARREKFIKLVQQGDYNRARHEWHEAWEGLLANYPSDRLLAFPEIRAIWLDRGTIVQTKSEAELAVIFDRFAASGINTVFFETINSSYPIYPSKIAPEQNPLTKGWDPLQAAVKLAHERGMELHAWVWVFAAANQRHNVILNKPIDDLGPVLSQRRDWGITDREGGFFDDNTNSKKAFFDPANPEVQQYLLSLLAEIVTNYDLDGIQLDYIRYPFQDPAANQTFGYSRESRRKFKQLTGVDPINIEPNHPLWSEWTKFRVQQVDKFVSSAAQMLRNKRPNLIISTAVFPIERQERLAKIQQNWEAWAQAELVDIIVPMTYALNSDELEKITQPLFSEEAKINTIIIPGIRLLNLPDMVAVDQMQLLRNLPTGGYALFAAENFNPSLQKIISNRQVVEATPLPTRQPFVVTVSHYQVLQKEWSFLLEKNEIDIALAARKQWEQESDLLAESFQRLAAEPSLKNLLSAQLALSSFQRQFRSWMKQYRQLQPYQVEVWENRLKMLDSLLSYGERTVNENQPEVAGR